MGSEPSRKRLIVNADDFGRTHAINQAVIEAHRRGLLTSASLMVNGEAAAEAVILARQTPSLGVGLHLCLVGGRSTLSTAQIPDLVDAHGCFSNAPVAAGWRYYFRRDLRPQIEREIAAQLDQFRQTGLRLDHVNGHLNLHLHPRVFDLLLPRLLPFKPVGFRLTRDPFWFNARLAGGRWAYRLSHALIFNVLAHQAQPRLRAAGLRHTDAVFGLLQTGRADATFVGRLLDRLPPGDSELYSHPALDESQEELAALLNPDLKDLATRRGIQWVRYQDL